MGNLQPKRTYISGKRINYKGDIKKSLILTKKDLKKEEITENQEKL